MRHSLCIYGNMPNGLNQYHLGPVEMGGQGRHLHEIHSIDQRASVSSCKAAIDVGQILYRPKELNNKMSCHFCCFL